MRSLLCLAVLASYVCGIAQSSLPVLGKPSPVDFHVRRVDWHPNGDAMTYERRVGDGQGIGVYRIGQDQGKVLVPLEKADRYESEWLQGTSHCVVIVYQDDARANPPARRIRVHLLNSETQQGREIFNREFPLALNPDMNVDTSPKLLHAVFRLYRNEGKERVVEHFVLKTNGQELSPCPDLDAADKQGLSGPSWSIDGTAVYSSRSSSDPAATFDEAKLRELVLLDRAAQKSWDGAKIRSEIMVADAYEKQKLVKDGLLALNLKWVAAPPAPPIGAAVLELMPQNGVLRQVRFRGPWEEVKAEHAYIASIDQPVLLNLGRSKAQSKSIWLVEGDKAPESGTLISSNAAQAWISPKIRAVAYLTDGALFIRELGKPN